MSQRIRDVFPGSHWLVRGSVPAASYLLIGPTGAGKTIFCKQFLYNGLVTEKPAIFLSTSETPDDLTQSMQSFGFDLSSFYANDQLRIVDCYSWKVGERSTSTFAIGDNRNYLLDVEINFDKARQNLHNVQVVFDSLSDMATFGEKTAVSRCLQRLIARIRTVNGRGIFTIAANTHDAQFMNRLRIQFDGIFEMKIDDSGSDLQRLFRIFSLKGARHRTTWTPFEITDHGIIMKRETDARCSFCGKLIDVMPIVERINDQTLSFDSDECVTTYKKFKDLYGPYFE
jgi:KaiC/GvpD/RAD55 family RecA-like ATPase